MGNSQTEIAKTLQLDVSIVSRDRPCLRQQAKNNIRKYIDERLPEEYEKCLVGLNSIVKEALSLAKECYAMKLELLTNAKVVDDAIRFVTANTNNKKAVARATCGIDINANQSNDVHLFNAMNDDFQQQQQQSGNGVPTCTINQVF